MSPNLQVSYDTVNLLRAYRSPKYRPEPLHPHLDERPGRNKGNGGCLNSSQGFLNLIDSDPEDGGIHFLDQSHLNSIQYVQEDRNSFQFATNPRKICPKMVSPNLRGGDFVLWDSRMIHGVAPPQLHTYRNRKGFRRSVIYINMYPRRGLPLKVKQKWEEWLSNGTTSCHCIYHPKIKIGPPES